MHLRTVLRSTPSLTGDRRDRQPLPMKIQHHDEFPKLDHRTAPSFWAERDWVIDSPPVPRARPGDGRHDQLGNFQTALLGRITPASTAVCAFPGHVRFIVTPFSPASTILAATISPW